MGAGKFTDDKGTTQSSYTIGGVAALTAVDALATREGLTLSKTATYTLQIAAGRCVVLTAGGSRDIAILPSAITKVGNVSWAVGSGNGGLDTGAIANNTTYHIYLIKRSDTGVVDAIASTSASAPTLPTNYTHYRRIGSVLTRSSAILDFDQYGNLFKWRSVQRDLDNTAVSTTAELRALTVPSGIQVEAIGILSPGYGSPGALNVIVSDPAQDDVAPNTSEARLAAFNSTAGAFDSGSFAYTTVPEIRRVTNTSAQLRFRRTGTYVATYQTTFQTLGYVDLTLDVAGGGSGGGGTGDFVGPASSTDNALVRFDGTTGKLGQNSSATVDDSGNLTANSAKVASVANSSAIAAGTIGAGGLQFVNNALPHGSAIVSDGTTNKILVVDDLITATPSAASVTTNQNNYSVGTANNIYINVGTSSVVFTGFTATNQVHGRRFRLWVQVGAAGYFQITHESASSTAGNRVTCPGASNIGITLSSIIELVYDGNSSRWRIAAIPLGDGYAYFSAGAGAAYFQVYGPFRYQEYTIGTLPSAASNSTATFIATDANEGDGALVRSNGTDWIDLGHSRIVTTAAPPSGGSMQAIILPANSGYAPSSNPARPDARTQQPVLAFDASTGWFWEWLICLPLSYAGTGLNVDILWTSAATGSGNVVWNGAFSRVQAGTTNLNSAPTYATAQAVTSAAPGTTGVAVVATIAFTNSQIDGALAGEPVKFRLSRNMTGNTLAVEAQVFTVTVRGA